MTSFYRTILYTFIVLLSVAYRLTNAQDSTDAVDWTETTNVIESVSTTTTPPVTNSSTISALNNSTTISVPTVTTVSTSTIVPDSTSTIEETNSSTIDNNLPPDERSGPGWWLLIALLITIVIVIIAGIVFYYRQNSPYRRFLRNWRSRDEDADNIILQLEQPEVTHGQWPPRISFT